ncbi:hypothetical protein A4H97_16390 [Niastella yeongjuensis]|uniref:Uncharacterized protein n=1 Tax=Niastella yeongjuensis TaxID=354355 RepID=A0A1V9E161_9BACT|nr:hypothetical protein [Niastella yeongjuensis]OQP39801.1 hypothetical protein A4H97_16390 [Niastella yeongjuensis]SEO05883.1 hypothetical protein SAMN05660816_02024 [Niastella yeongjuensis]
MLNHSTIQRVLSGFLLVLFAFSITPKKVLHDLVANHRDTHSKACADHITTKIVKAGFNCNTEDLVVESPFIENNCTIDLPEPPALSLIFSERPENFYYFHQIFAELRGPPAIS